VREAGASKQDEPKVDRLTAVQVAMDFGHRQQRKRELEVSWIMAIRIFVKS
jgi:hypothetical protein